MLTNLGKYLRKLRIDNGEILKDMAEKLEVTASFLSAVENGKKKMPTAWNYQLCKLYQLNACQQEELTKAIASSEQKIEISIENVPDEQKELAVAFARKFSDLSEFQTRSLHDILNGRRGD